MNALEPYIGAVKALAIVMVLLAVFAGGYKFGAQGVQVAWNAEKLAAEQQAENLRLLRQGKVDKVGADFAVTAQKERVVTQTITKEVEKYVSPTDCPLSPGFRVLYDAAATGEDVIDPRGTDAAAVTAQEVARSTIENFAACRYDQSRLEALQEIIRTTNGPPDH